MLIDSLRYRLFPRPSPFTVTFMQNLLISAERLDYLEILTKFRGL